MTVQTIEWCTEKCLDCGTLPTLVILCVPPSIVLVETTSAYGTLQGTLTASRTSTCDDICGPCKYVYTIEYDDTQLVEGYLLVQAHIKDIICDKCLISFVLGNADMGITCADVPNCQDIVSVEDTASVDLTISPATPQTLTADVKISADADNALEEHADGLYVEASAGGGATIGAPVGGGTAGGNLYVDSSGNLQQDTNQVLFGAALDYDPANFHTSNAVQKVWLKCFDAAFMTKAGGGTPGNGDLVESIFDSDGVTIKFQQPTGGLQPTFTSVATPAGTPALSFVGTGNYMESTDYGYLKNSNYVSLGIVFCWPDSGNMRPLFRERDGTNVRERLTVNGNSFTVIYCSVDGGTQTSQDTLRTTNMAVDWQAILVQWNVANSMSSIFINGYNSRFFNGAVSNAGPISNTDATFCRLGGQLAPALTTNTVIADFFIYTGALMSDWQRTQWFAAVKAKFGLTTY